MVRDAIAIWFCVIVVDGQEGANMNVGILTSSCVSLVRTVACEQCLVQLNSSLARKDAKSNAYHHKPRHKPADP